MIIGTPAPANPECRLKKENMENVGHGIASTIESLKAWASQPFDSQMSLSRWFLFTGLVLVLVIMWIMILRELKGELA